MVLFGALKVRWKEKVSIKDVSDCRHHFKVKMFRLLFWPFDFNLPAKFIFI